MCGICGVRSFAEPPEVAPLRGMIAALAHRGPDGSGYFRDSEVALGHARLAIIDAAGGTQPMANEDGSIWVTFNGEIFNYVELASQLRARGHRFRTRSDTEVVVHAWEEWGPDCFSRFNGQWAVAIWDRRTRELALARDPLRHPAPVLHPRRRPGAVRLRGDVAVRRPRRGPGLRRRGHR